MTGASLLALVIASSPWLVSTATEGPVLAEVVSALQSEIVALGPVEEPPPRSMRRLDVEDVVRSVDQSYPELLALEQKISAAEGKLQSSAGIFDPKLSLALQNRTLGYYDANRVDAQLEQLLPLWGTVVYGGYRRSDGKLPIYELEDETLGGGELRLGLNVPLLRGGSIDDKRAKFQQGEQELRMRQDEQRAARLVFLRLAGRAYWEWVANVEAYRVQRELLRLAEMRDAQVASMVDRGAVPELERLENLRAILSRRDGLIKARRKVEKSAIKLSLFLRNDDGEPIIPSIGSAPSFDRSAQLDLDLDHGLARAVAQRPELRYTQAEIERARVELSLATNRVLPSLDVKVEGSKDLGSGDVDQIETLDPAVLKLGAKLSMPLLLREGRGARTAAEAELEAVMIKSGFVADKIRAEVRDTYSQNLASRQRVEIDLSGASAARAAAQAEVRRFVLGATSLLVVNLREQAAAAAAVKLIEALRDARQAELEWETVIVSARFAQEADR